MRSGRFDDWLVADLRTPTTWTVREREIAARFTVTAYEAGEKYVRNQWRQS